MHSMHPGIASLQTSPPRQATHSAQNKRL